MVAGNLKRVVVLRNLSSNLIEEAILILKSEPGSGGDGTAQKGGDKSKQDNDFLFKEAESIISGYIRENNIQVVQDRRSHRRDRRLKKTPFSGAFISIMILSGIALLIFVLLKLI